MQSVPGFHDQTVVEIFCYSLSADDNTSFRRKIAAESEHLVDLSKVGFQNKWSQGVPSQLGPSWASSTIVAQVPVLLG